MIVVFHGLDRPDAGALRQSTRAEHAAYHATRGNLVGGPLRGDDGEVRGTLVIFEAPDLAIAAEVMDADPYVRAGLFERTSITELVAVDWPTSS